MRRSLSIVIAIFVSGCFGPVVWGMAEEQPNILLIMADDLGYADLGCYGGEIDTPNLDRLAENGVRFSHFRVTPMCTTTRVALMAGMSYQAAGEGSYKHAIPLPTLLQEAGYRTMMTGKWHAGKADPRSPEVFDRFFGFLGGMTDCYAGGNDWFLGEEPFNDFGSDFDATTAITDEAIVFMDEAIDDEEPFFMFVSYNAPHHPLQARRDTVEKYRGHYADGYEAVREARYERQLEMGLVDPDWTPSPPGVEVRRWDDLPEDRREIEDFRMAAYAAMVDEMDAGIGRLLDLLKESGQYDDTLVIFFSDNGGDYGNGSILTDENQVPWLPHNNPTSSNGWAWVKNTPFANYKHASHEGALAVPMIVHWPKYLEQPAGVIEDERIDVTDIYPTLLDVTGVSYPGKAAGLRPLTGYSFLPVLTDDETFNAPPRFLWFAQSRAWIEDDMKVVSLYGGPWQLYDMRADRTEQHDLSDERPKETARFADKWMNYAKSIGMPRTKRLPPKPGQHGWGYHRLRMFSPFLVDTFPANSQLTAPGSQRLEMNFSKPVSFSKTSENFIQLYEVGDEKYPVWTGDRNDAKLKNKNTALVFDDVPKLKPDTQYFVLIKPGSFKVGGRPVGVINDGAYWWRFRTSD
ncbi:arylsulfatase [Rubellicoccus peritrichatus]|uniref:Arylsulfatase n=1 Tax=Rubellicoccus peritrichatus TaxID=3080537 RepID=A0AAQ3QXZ3_9BACT|nr:arylsulfatase [Puniceicoccus sp. CR14]WOO43305.1 arylsulfatase [Puniceicoccus sp. CR14]